MNNSFLIYETGSNLNKKTAHLRAVCSSKRQAITLAVNMLLEMGLIATVQIGAFKETLSANNKTEHLKTNVFIKEVEQNKILKSI